MPDGVEEQQALVGVLTCKCQSSGPSAILAYRQAAAGAHKADSRAVVAPLCFAVPCPHRG